MKWSNFYREMVDRNIGVITEEEQERLRNTCIAVTGCGGMGGLSAAQLVRLGVGHVKIADFDKFEVHNLSRQCGSTASRVGKKKTEVLAKYFREINPELRLDVFEDGVKPKNVEDFVKGAAIIIDGMDYSDLRNQVALYKAATKNNLCVISSNAVGFGINLFVFGPKTIPIEKYLNLSIKTLFAPQEAMKKLVPYIPSYADPEIIEKAARGKINIPNLVMPQHLGTSMAVSEAIMMVLGKISPPDGPDPRIFILDLLDRKFEITG